MTGQAHSHADLNSGSEFSSSECMKKVELLQGYLESSIKDVGRKRKINQQRATSIKVLILCLSGGATVLLGLDIGMHAQLPLKNLAFAFTAIVTVLNALEPFFNYRALWVEHERANASLYQLKDRLNFYVTGKEKTGLDISELEEFYAQYEQIWEMLNQAWIAQRQRYHEISSQPNE
ncbi:SLATT domain-containing protein [Nodosilinea sp. P-1105]|uniref:SLATT domain-containing protein n=1 Tax=Nodosilinea sp. P-1105 TaxID=2546229 RepID=UPI00146AC2EC|nr:SLATT domain-containing protein [Nodosilinea sp. P-1105]NMF82036.1 SLATT domain-containing protein [Nodosilinea sp. P-1105]